MRGLILDMQELSSELITVRKYARSFISRFVEDITEIPIPRCREEYEEIELDMEAG